jgi:hypothetical protein
MRASRGYDSPRETLRWPDTVSSKESVCVSQIVASSNTRITERSAGKFNPFQGVHVYLV